jgi:hypothetical protein
VEILYQRTAVQSLKLPRYYNAFPRNFKYFLQLCHGRQTVRSIDWRSATPAVQFPDGLFAGPTLNDRDRASNKVLPSQWFRLHREAQGGLVPINSTPQTFDFAGIHVTISNIATH